MRENRIANTTNTERHHTTDPREPKILGSSTQAFIVDTIIAFLDMGPVVLFNVPVTAMDELSPVLKGILVSSPLLATAANQIPMTRAVKKNGGKKPILAIQLVSLGGLTGLIILAATSDITRIRKVDYRFIITLLSGYAIGMGSGSFPLIIDTMKWTRQEKHLPIVQAAFGGLVDVSNSITPIVVHLLRPYGYSVAFGIYAGTLLVGILTSALFLHASPFDQLKNKLPTDVAKERALAFGQLPHMMEVNAKNVPFKKALKKYLSLFIDSRAIVLDFSLFITLGSFFVTGTIFPSLLKNGFGVEESEAIYTSSIANLVAIIARLIGGKVISKWDNTSGGVHVHYAACGLSIAAAIPLVAFELPRWALYSSVGILNVGLGIGVVTPLNLALPWSKPKNKDLEEFDVSDMFGLLSTVGTMGGIILPIVLGLMVEGLGVKGYQYYFLLLIAMVTFSAGSVAAVHHNVNQQSGNLFGNTVNFFVRPFRSNAPKYSFDNKYTEPEPVQAVTLANT